MSARDKTSFPALRMSGESISAEVVLADAAGSGGWESEATNLVLKNIVLVSPAMQEANNGNWHTAHRWAKFLSGHCDIALTSQWPSRQPASSTGREPQLMLALHARRSAESIHAWARAWPAKPLIVVLTGTDLYRDIHSDADAQKSLALATHLVVLQDAGLGAVPEAWRSKTHVIYQSAPRLVPAVKSTHSFCALMVGHLRQEKGPLTFMKAAEHDFAGGVRFVQIGDALEPPLAESAVATARNTTRYRWLGGLSRSATRQHIKRAHVLVNCSEMEGGAQVILEAVQAGTPVLASCISGNIGMLGEGYAGYFETGDHAQLAALVRRCRAEPPFLALLQDQCRQRAPLFEPARERGLVLNLLHSALHTKPNITPGASHPKDSHERT
ncbi:MAG: selenoneine biosynthesis selenosugar synthase SenB [Pseudomonadota bacterium]